MKLRVCLVQYDIHWHQHLANQSAIESLLPADIKADLILLPEMFATGFTMEPDAVAQSMDGASVRWMKELSTRVDADVVGSLVIADEDRYFNRLLWVRHGQVISTYDKRHLFAKAGEHERYQAGHSRTVESCNGFRCMPMICYDLRFPVWSRNDTGYDVLVYVANWPAARAYAWRQLLIARAIENQSFVVGLNRVGMDANGLCYKGGSMVLDPWGSPLADLGDDAQYKVVELHMEELARCRESLPFLQDRDHYVIGDEMD